MSRLIYRDNLMPLPKRERWLEFQFPELIEGEYEIIAWASPRYNCFDVVEGSYYDWRQPTFTLNGLIGYFQSKGWSRCDCADLEPGYVKLAIYADDCNLFSHVCIQTKDGKFLSKLGDGVLIKHDKATALEGCYPSYGFIRVYMMRLQKPTDP